MMIGNYVSEPGALSLLGATLILASFLLRRAFRGGLRAVNRSPKVAVGLQTNESLTK